MAYPVKPVVLPSNLKDVKNGQLGPCQLDAVFFAGVGHASMNRAAIRAWNALNISCFGATGHWLTAVSLGDVYRSYESQVRLFKSRYVTTFDEDTCKVNSAGNPVYKTWNGVRWYQLKNTAIAAVPGTSNHGWGLAIDVAIYDPNKNDGDAFPGDPTYIASNKWLFAWLLENADDFGFCWEAQSEPWHIRFYVGDNLPQRVLDVENWLANAK